MLRSVLPGRIRAHLGAGMPMEEIDSLQASLEKAAPGAQIHYNPRSGGLLVTWKPGVKRDAAVLKAVEAHFKSAPSCSPKLTWPTMKTVKQGMALSLGVALTSLAFRSERVHMWAGGAFAALLSRHLYVYRKRIFK
ncbi:MAG: hypothetical protein HY795_16685 [Desulfovibrio sp.]|nr:hypothetical protein [Desulfovibrio sp.]MBI4961559.1 hypothetical protein [Desulfovibrio sp.]